MNSNTVVKVEAVVKSYLDHRAVDGISFTLPKGVCLALLGHNGAGKTTLMKLMLGVTRPTSGNLEILGHNPATAPIAFRQQLGFLPENVAFYDEMTGLDTLVYFARLKSASVTRCWQLLTQVGLKDASHRRVKTYSKGMRQRLGLAQALLGRSGLLLLDEPTTGMDPMVRQEFFSIIQEVRNEGGTVILSSHILTELETHTDLVAILRKGRLTAFGPLATLRQQVNLPVRLRLAVGEGATGVAGELADLNGVVVDENTLDVFCSEDDKMATIRRIAQLEVVKDIEIHLPTLDAVYGYFSGLEG